MVKNKSNTDFNYSAKPNFFGMIQNVLLAGIRTGHTVFVILALIVLIVILKLESSDLHSLVDKFFNLLTKWSILGWILFVLMVLYSWLMFKKLRRRHQQELNRISGEKSKWQERAFNRKLKSTK